MPADDVAILDFDNAKTKRMVIDHVRNAKGLHRFMFKRCREQRSLQANAYLWGVVYKEIQAGLLEAWGERHSVEWIHVYMKKKFLTEPVVNRNTGEVIDETVGSTADLDTAQFGEYLDKVIQFAAEYLKVEVPQPT